MNKCFHEDGNISEILNEKEDGVMEDFLKKWQTAAVKRDEQLNIQNEIFQVDEHKAVTKQTCKELKEQQIDAEMKIM